MTTYGLIDAGFVPKTADVIESELTEDIKSIPGFEDLLTDPGSGGGQLISVLTEREAFIWQLCLLIWQSNFREMATGVSLDYVLSNIAKSRQEEARSTVTLTLYNRSSTNPVPVEADSQARQAATGVLFELLEDSEIPALTTLHNNLDIDDILWQSGTTVRANFNGTPALADVAVGDEVTFTGCTNASNNGTFIISAVNTGSYWVEFPNPGRTSSTGDETSSPGTADIVDVEASVTANAQSYSAGPFEASIGSINEIVTPVSGWDGVSNLQAAQVGRNRESDTEARRRIQAETVSAQGGTLESVRNAVQNITGVTYVAANENDTGAVVDGLKANSIHITVVGGADQDIVNAIGEFKPAGIATNGLESGTWTDSTGNAHTIYFDRVDEVNPYLEVNITHDTNYPTDGDDRVRAALEAVSFTNGQDLLNYLLVTAIGAAAIPGVLTVEVLQSLTPGPTLPDNITIDPTEVVNITADRITVNS